MKNEGFSRKDIDNLETRERIYVKKFDRFISDVNNLEVRLSIKNYDYKNFIIIDTGYSTVINFDQIFITLISKLGVNINKITLFITPEADNLIDFEEGIPSELKGCSVGYNIYKLVISHYGWISSDKRSSNDALNLWWNLLQDDDLYCISSNFFSYVISKVVSDEKLKEVLDKIKIRKEVDFPTIEFDDDIKDKISKIYKSYF
jgi:hypothetical protein